MNAGSSATGVRFATKYADMVFTSIAEDANDETTARIEPSAPSAARSSDGSSRCGPQRKPSTMSATTSSTRATGTRLLTWYAADAGPDRQALASVYAAPAGVVTC
jgi:hypothetical protein